MPKYDNKVGALWSRVSGKGNKFLSGKIDVGGESFDIVVFKNTGKKTEKHPDYELFSDQLSDYNKENGGQPRRRAAKQEEDDDVPF